MAETTATAARLRCVREQERRRAASAQGSSRFAQTRPQPATSCFALATAARSCASRRRTAARFDPDVFARVLSSPIRAASRASACRRYSHPHHAEAAAPRVPRDLGMRRRRQSRPRRHDSRDTVPRPAADGSRMDRCSILGLHCLDEILRKLSVLVDTWLCRERKCFLWIRIHLSLVSLRLESTLLRLKEESSRSARTPVTLIHQTWIVVSRSNSEH